MATAISKFEDKIKASLQARFDAPKAAAGESPVGFGWEFLIPIISDVAIQLLNTCLSQFSHSSVASNIVRNDAYTRVAIWKHVRDSDEVPRERRKDVREVILDVIVGSKKEEVEELIKENNQRMPQWGEW